MIWSETQGKNEFRICYASIRAFPAQEPANLFLIMRMFLNVEKRLAFFIVSEISDIFIR